MPANGQAKAAEQLNNIFGNGLNQKLKAARTSTSPSTVTRKTSTPTAEAVTSPRITFETSNTTNVLSNYRAYTYRFTLACLSRDQVDNPDSYVRDPRGLDLIILRSGGKQAGAMQSRGGASKADVAADNALQNAYEATEEELARSKKKIESLNQNPEMVAKFNSESAGRYDMFIENVQIETIAAFTKVTNTTKPTTMTFDIVEPYSVNGFLETIGVASKAAGWNNYAEAAYVLLVEFIVYNDRKQDFEVLENNKRYLPIKFHNMEIEITERGTLYKCGAVSWGEVGNGVAGRLPSTLSADGNNIGEILSDLMEKFNKQLTTDRKNQFRDDGPVSGIHDVFEIRFDTVNSDNKTFNKNDDSSEIKKSELFGNNDSKQVSLLNPQSSPDGVNYPSSDPEKSKGASTYNVVSAGSDKKYTISFKSNQNLRDVISELVINSEYVRKKLKDLYENEGKEATPDNANGLVDYFMVHVETEEIPGRDELLNRAIRKYIFVVSPYKVHRSKFPSFGKLRQNLSDIKKISQRSYNYIYTGKNTEILNFKLQYNLMYFEALPKGSGVNDQPSQSNSSSPNDATNPVIVGSNATEQAKKNDKNSNEGSTPVAPIGIDKNSENDTKQGTSIPRNDDPYYALSNNLHKALTDPKSNMVVAEIDILGDPYFLCTGGIGNQLKTNNTTDTEAQILYSDLIIDITFQNPQDIGADGFISFNKNQPSPFHGAYQVIKITNYFKDGAFKQHLELVKIPGQDAKNTLQALDRKSNTEGEASEGGKSTNDTNDKTDKSLPNSKETENKNNPPKSTVTKAPRLPLSFDEQKIAATQGVEALAKAKGVNINELSGADKAFVNDIKNSALGKILSSIGFNR